MNSQDSNSEYNNSVLRLYYRFLRKIGLFRELYGEHGKFIPRLGDKPRGINVFPISDFSLTYTCKLMTGISYYKLCFDYEENERLQAEAERLEKEPAEEVKEDGDLSRYI